METGMDIRVLGIDDLDLLLAVEPGLFDAPVDPVQARTFLRDPLHFLVAAVEGGRILAFASGTVLLHPDKQPSLFVNEVGTREEHQRRGLATAVMQGLFDHARKLGCRGIWLGTEPDNLPARALYRALGGQEQAFTGYAWDGAFDAD
jgi:ribosomal protein S18 acetylase RimI-like enzyme